jgi:hypothetical protein
MRKRAMKQKDLFEESSEEVGLPAEVLVEVAAEVLVEVAAQLALLMQSVIHSIEMEVRDEQDPR